MNADRWQQVVALFYVCFFWFVSLIGLFCLFFLLVVSVFLVGLPFSGG